MQAQDPEARKKNPFGRVGPVRPPAKAFNPEEARELALLVTRVPGVDGQAYLQLGPNRFINGYLEKSMVMRVRARGRAWGTRIRRASAAPGCVRRELVSARISVMKRVFEC